MITRNRGRFSAPCVLGLTLALAACTTTGDKSSTTSAATPSQPAAPTPQFQPGHVVSRLYQGEGRHADLIAPTSQGVWVTSEVIALKREKDMLDGQAVNPFYEAAAASINSDFYVFECHVESNFGDPSIAYDVVGLRGMDVYLETPNGDRVAPVQRLIASSAEEADRGTLKWFKRTCIVVFPKHDVWLNAPTIPSDAGWVRLVLDGHDSTFYYEWPAAREPGAPLTPSDTAQATHYSFNDMYRLLSPLAHIFQD